MSNSTSKFKVGDKVTYTNSNGVFLGVRTVIGIEESEIRGPCYFITPTDTPWFAVSEASFRLVTDGAK